MNFPTETEATEWGQRILKKSFPANAGWRLRVWENIGWHVTFQHGMYVQVFPCDYHPGNFWCLIGTDGGGKCEWTPHITYRSKDPMMVVLRTLLYARKSIRADIALYNETAAGLAREQLSLKGTVV